MMTNAAGFCKWKKRLKNAWISIENTVPKKYFSDEATNSLNKRLI